MALLAKKKGMVRTWPMPMNRSRVRTMQAMISENEANSADPRMTRTPTLMMAAASARIWTPRTSATT